MAQGTGTSDAWPESVRESLKGRGGAAICSQAQAQICYGDCFSARRSVLTPSTPNPVTALVGVSPGWLLNWA
jgi:hypothetical protein